MKSFVLKVIPIFLLISIVLAAVYGIWILLSSYPLHVFFYGYLFVVVVVSIFTIFISIKNTSGSFKDMDIKNAALFPVFAQINSSLIKKICFRASQVFEGLSSGLTFPAFFIYTTLKIKSISSNSQRGQLLKLASYDLTNGTQMFNMFVTLVILIIAFAFYSYNKVEWAALWAIISITSVVCLILTVLMSGLSLPKIFKIRLGNPYISFFIYGVAAAIVLWGGMLFIKASVYQITIDESLIISTAKSLFSPAQIFNNFINLREFSLLSVSELFLAVLFYITVASSLFRWKDFIRSEDDVNNIAKNLVILGKYTKSLDWLNSVSINNSKFCLTKAMAFLSINRFDQGLAEMEKAMIGEELKGIDVYSMSLFSGLNYCLPLRTNSKLFDKWLNSDPEDALLLMVLQAAPHYFSEEELSRIELDTRIRTRPIHHALLLSSMNKFGEMGDLLENSDPNSEFEKIICSIFLLIKSITQDLTEQEAHLYVHDWLDNKLPLVEDYSRELKDNELFFIIVTLMVTVSVIRLAKVSREDEIIYLRNELKKRNSLISNNTVIATMVNEQEKQLMA